MPLMYVDESFNEQEFWLSGLLVPMAAACALEQSLDGVMAQVERQFAIPMSAELHGHELAQGKKDWKPLAGNLRARLGVYESALRAIQSASGVRTFQYGLDRIKLRQRYADPWPERQILIGHLAQRAHRFLADDEHLVIVVDDSPAQDGMRKHIRKFKTEGTHSRFDSSPLGRIVDTLYFAPSHESRLLQASDLVSYAHLRSRNPGRNAKAAHAARELWGLVDSISSSSMWHVA